MALPFELRPVTAAETRPLRQRILRPHQALEQVGFAHDDDADALHVGAFAGGAMVGTATVHREAMPGAADADAARDWRLRGMATIPEMRRQGCGAALVRACMEHAKARGGTRMWCNARAGVADFYRALGFVTVGEAFDLPEIGPHYLMWTKL